MLVAALIVLNIPVYLLVGWIVFDTRGRAIDTFWDGVVEVLKQALVPRLVRVLLGDDGDEGGSALVTVAYLAACAVIVYGEWWVIDKFWG